MLELEDELQAPTGIWTIKSPKLALGGVLISTECGVMYEIMNTEGLRCGKFIYAESIHNEIYNLLQIEDLFPKGDNL
jgi:hypothetical protein